MTDILIGFHIWEHLPYMAVIWSVDKNEDLSSFMDTYLVWIELRTSAVFLKQFGGTQKLLDLSSFMDK